MPLSWTLPDVRGISGTRLEERLPQAEKMNAIGRVATGIAHDFDNLLGPIVAYAEMLIDEAPEGTKRSAQNVLTSAMHCCGVVDQFSPARAAKAASACPRTGVFRRGKAYPSDEGIHKAR
jgi:hypothetical protein